MALTRVAQLAIDIVVNARRASIQLARVRRDLNTTAKSAGKFNRALSGLTAGVALFFALERSARLLSASVGSVVTSYARLEKQILDVEIIAQSNDVQKLTANFLALGKVLPGAEFQTISEVMQNAARLGIRGNQQLSEFTRVATLLSQVAGDIAPADAARDLGTLLLNFDLSIDKAEALASAINKLSDDYPVLTGEILKTSARLAGFAKAVGFSETELAALVTTLLKSRLSATTVRTSIVRLSTALQDEPLEVQKALKLTNDEIARLRSLTVQGKPFKAIQLFVELLGNLPAVERFGALKELGLATSRVVQNISVLVDKQDDLAEVLQKANKEYEIATNLLEKQQIVAAQATSKIIDLKKAWELFKASLLDNKFLTDTITKLTSLVGVITPAGFKTAAPKQLEAVDVAKQVIEKRQDIEAVEKSLRTIQKINKVIDTLRVRGTTLGGITKLREFKLQARLNKLKEELEVLRKIGAVLFENAERQRKDKGKVPEKPDEIDPKVEKELARQRRVIELEELIKIQDKKANLLLSLAGKPGEKIALRERQRKLFEFFDVDPKKPDAQLGLGVKAISRIFDNLIEQVDKKRKDPAQFLGLTEAWKKATLDAEKNTENIQLLKDQKILAEIGNNWLEDMVRKQTELNKKLEPLKVQ